MSKLKYGSELEVNGVVYVLVDVRILRRLTGQSHDQSWCKFCCFTQPLGSSVKCPRRATLALVCKDRVNGVFVKKLEV